MKMAHQNNNILFTTLFLFHFFFVPSFSRAFSLGGIDGFRLENLRNRVNDESFDPFLSQDDVEIPEQGGEAEAGEPKKPTGGKAQNNNNNNNNNVDPNLKEGFYKNSCPKAEEIVAKALAELVNENPNAGANILRLQFHDCFVVGCDASILLDYAQGGEKVEKSSMFNGQLLKGADYIDDIKAKLEEECPGKVSCSDVLSFAANEAMALAGLPRREPLGGRRDALLSLASIAEDNNLPLPNWNMDQMIALFNRKGFTTEEMVVMLGGHSIGTAHCEIFMERVYNFEKTRKPDPSYPQPVVDELKQACANPGTPLFRNPPVNFDETPTKLDNLFFKNMVERNKTLLITDSHLINDPRTLPTVRRLATELGLFEKWFPDMMVRMGAMNVLTGEQGEVRKTCRSTN